MKLETLPAAVAHKLLDTRQWALKFATDVENTEQLQAVELAPVLATMSNVVVQHMKPVFATAVGDLSPDGARLYSRVLAVLVGLARSVVVDTPLQVTCGRVAVVV